MSGSMSEHLVKQFDASLCMLHQCIRNCPESIWTSRLLELRFCQVAFHALFFTDYYLESSPDSFRGQRFHIDHEHIFRDYEELEYRPQVLTYEQEFVTSYLFFCRQKAADVICNETIDTLDGPSGFERKEFTRAELHVNNIRHIQYHAAQLSYKLRLENQNGVEWVGSGWE